MTFEMIRSEIISAFGLMFYNAYIENSDGISGSRYIKENFSVNEINKIAFVDKKPVFLKFKESFSEQPFFSKVEEIIVELNQLSIDSKEKLELSEKSFLDHYDKIEKEFIHRVNLKINSNYTKESLFSNEKVKNEILDKMKNTWNKAYKKNYKNSLNEKYWKFEENLKSNVFLSTIQYF